MPNSHRRMAVTLAQMRKYQSLNFPYPFSAEECRKLSERVKETVVHNLDSSLSISFLETEKAVLITGFLKANLTQTCIISLQPIKNQLHEEFSLKFISRESYEASLDTEVEEGISHYRFSLEDDAELIPLENETIRFFDLLSDQVILSLDPYPRAKNVIFSGYTMVASPPIEKTSDPVSSEKISQNSNKNSPSQKKKFTVISSSEEENMQEGTHKPFSALSKIQLTKDVKND